MPSKALPMKCLIIAAGQGTRLRTIAPPSRSRGSPACR